MRIVALVIMSSLSATAWCQTEQCAEGGERTLKLESARAEHGDQYQDVRALVREIRDFQQPLLAEYFDQTIEEICNVQPGAEEANETSGPDLNEMICRSEQVTGSHRRREVCMTRAQREANRNNTLRDLRDRRAPDP